MVVGTPSQIRSALAGMWVLSILTLQFFLLFCLLKGDRTFTTLIHPIRGIIKFLLNSLIVLTVLAFR